MTAKFAYDGARIISRPSSLISALATTVESAAADVAYRHKVGDAWQEVTWGEVGAAVNSAAAAYADLGVKPGDSVVVLADVSYSAIVAELAATAAGAVVTTLNSKVSSADLAFVLADLRPALAVAGQVEDAANLRSRVGAPDQIVLLDGDQGFTWSKLLTEGADALARSPGPWPTAPKPSTPRRSRPVCCPVASPVRRCWCRAGTPPGPIRARPWSHSAWSPRPTTSCSGRRWMTC